MDINKGIKTPNPDNTKSNDKTFYKETEKVSSKDSYNNINNQKKKILLIGTGGTIASQKSDDGLKPSLSSNQLLKYVQGVFTFADIDTIELFNIDSTNMHPKHWLIISNCIKNNYIKYDGFVICHGTDTMAYTAAALSYLIQNSKKPVVITGAQKPIDMDVTDAKTNLYDSILFASSQKAYGINIVFDGKVICGTRARKERSKSYNAFSSINFPYLAVIQDHRIFFYIDDKKHNNENIVFYDKLNTRIGLLKLIPSMDAQLLKFMALNYDAIIIESFGVGGLPSYEDVDFKAAISDLTKLGKIVVMSTQVPLEGSHMSIYAVGKNIKEEFSLIENFDMTLESAVAKLMWILAITKEPHKVREMFYTPINRDLLWQ
ncbi:asparaginase [Johnsonella ignava]|uniref:asparaginase n=1 Tax=Johnsonella ignava TaxID=43995 RepID=UPI0023EF5846|nr:asparaginase [Johnsonella ignava]